MSGTIESDIISYYIKGFRIIKKELEGDRIRLEVSVQPNSSKLKKGESIFNMGPLFEDITELSELGDKLEKYEKASLRLTIKNYLPGLSEKINDLSNPLLKNWLKEVANKGLGFYTFNLVKEPGYSSGLPYEQTIFFEGAYPFDQLFNMSKKLKELDDDHYFSILSKELLRKGLGTRIELKVISELEQALGGYTVISHDCLITPFRKKQLKRIVNAHGLPEDSYNSNKLLRDYKVMLLNYVINRE